MFTGAIFFLPSDTGAMLPKRIVNLLWFGLLLGVRPHAGQLARAVFYSYKVPRFSIAHITRTR
jgi:hypothetical protein